MKTKTHTLIIGAGIVGASAAYGFAQLGNKDVLVIDKGPLFDNDGSTSHAPGGVNPLSNNPTMARLAADSIDLYETLPPWRPGRKPLTMVGGVDVARSDERMDEVKRLYTNAKGFGVACEMITPSQISELFPLMDGSLFKGGLYTPRKPVIAGPHVCGSLAAEAERMTGVRFVAKTKATGFVVKNGRLHAVKTNNPALETIECEQLLLCTNIWSPALVEPLGISIPLMAAEHQYLKTEPLPELAHVSDRSSADQEIIYPSVRDMDGGLYYRHWWDSMGVGSYHHKPIVVPSRVLGESADHPFTPDDFVEARRIAEETVPALRGVRYPYKINGMFSFSVDGLPILGETAVRGLWVAAAVWITNGGGVGQAMARWMTDGDPGVDMRALSVDRFLPYQKTEKYLRLAAAKSYAEVHDVVHPAQWPSKPRRIKHTPFFPRHEALGAVFVPSGGLELPYWLDSNGRLLEKYSAQVPDRTGWGARYWSRTQGAEHLATRESVGLFDLTSLAAVDVSGTDACTFLNYACTNQMDISVGRVTYTLLCTQRGGIKRDLTAARLADNIYRLFTGIGTLPLELAWLNQLAERFDVSITDRSTHFAALGLFGPNARDVLQRVTLNDVSSAAFPFYTWQTIEIGMTPVYAMRISYVGELGWELHMAHEDALAVYDQLWQAGRDVDLVASGVGAMRSMRFEKGYRLWGSDIHTEHNPYEAGMGWLVKFDKGDFVGRDALLALRERPLRRQLVTLTLDDANAAVTGNEPIFSNGTVVGQITSGNYGYSVGNYIALGYVPPEFAAIGTPLEVEYLAKKYTAAVAPTTLFDPKNARMKA